MCHLFSYQLTNSSVIFLWVSVVCVLFIYTISISIFVFHRKKLVIESNQQIWHIQVSNFWKEKTRGKWFFYVSELFNVIKIAMWAYGRCYKYIFICACQSTRWRVFRVCMCDIRSVKNHILHQTSVSLRPCCIKYLSGSFWY